MGNTYFVGTDGRTDGRGWAVCLFIIVLGKHARDGLSSKAPTLLGGWNLGGRNVTTAEICCCSSPLLDTLMVSFMLIWFCC